MKRIIKKALEAKDISELPVLCILCEREKNLVTGVSRRNYILTTGTERKQTMEIPKKTALELISLCGLIKYPVKDKNTGEYLGEVFDTPDKEFYRNFHHLGVCI